MIFTTENLLPSTTYGTPSGNYDGTSSFFFGDPFPAASYYGGQGSTQTSIITTTGFQGNITLQGTLSTLHNDQAAWFDIEKIDDSSAPVTDTVAITMRGNFVWIRAAVTDFTAGTINSATVVY